MKSIEQFYDMPMGVYCGVLLRGKMAKKLAKLLYKQNQEIKELLASDLSQIEASNWTLAYPNGEQTVIKFYTPSSEQQKLERIKLINKPKVIEHLKDGVFIANNMEDAKEKFNEWFLNQPENKTDPTPPSIEGL